jgi:hypothetical protein
LRVMERLIVERLDGETLVYDTERNEAHALSGAGAAEFLAAADDVSRREVLRKLALAGVAAAGTGALVKTIIAPSAAQAQSPACDPACTQGIPCCNGVCCGMPCCSPTSQTPGACCPTFPCCNAGAVNTCGLGTGTQCTTGSQCCSGSCLAGACA